jgi:hypothetical protein
MAIDEESNEDGADDDLTGDELPPVPEGARRVQFHYKKSNFFRVVYSEGAWGGISPSGRIVVNFFSERAPIPRRQTQTIFPDGTMGPVVTAEQKKGVMREVEVAITMDLDHAKNLHQWLGQHIERLEHLQAEARRITKED